ncbi:DUF4062 domain-containing protein [Mesorhizobium sp.]|uniref:DUF4062 domain-containing protein n=1 Tax=Mesorhizobium sp. TaxID=1871066 RepID=UPI000FE7DA0F|nr:DUF4062 domain-containing protein [Mesorhizobium sp.]RWD74791.1 MAG: DUF4062 domain-containing protein [Mesorhizobium sp.]
MTAKKYQVFVSSTFRDLVDERQDAIRNILDLKHIPAGMELFPATDVTQLDYIKKVIDECDYYLLIMGGRYGSMDAEGVSYTEREYDYAVENEKVVLAFVHDDPASIPVGKSDVKPEVVAALNAFRKKVMNGRLVRGWTTRQNLEPLVLKSLLHAFNDLPQIGWIRGDAVASEPLLEQANKLLQENADLKAEIAKLVSSNNVKVKDIADLDDAFTIRYESRHYSRGSSYTHTRRTVTLTWRQIFLAIAAELDTAKTDHVILVAVIEAVEQAGIGYKPDRMDDTDRVRIKVQMIALGLIETQVSKTTQGGVAEFLYLTAKGRALFIEGMVVRKSHTN